MYTPWWLETVEFELATLYEGAHRLISAQVHPHYSQWLQGSEGAHELTQKHERAIRNRKRIGSYILSKLAFPAVLNISI